ncbi:hypothetical protein [uncultured Gordonia sp.]|nr:hypothetical protein [uncultured Gordonia sp.]
MADDFDLFQQVMSFVNPFSGEDGWQKMQREVEGEPLTLESDFRF